MTGYTAVIFADYKFPGDRVAEDAYIALAAVFGKPALDWVIAAVRGISRVERLIVIGPEFIDDLLCSRYIDQRLSPASAAVRRTMSRLGYLPLPEDGNRDDRGLLFADCGCVYLTAAVMETMIGLFEEKNAEIAFPLLRSEPSARSGPELFVNPASGEKWAISAHAGFAHNKRSWGTLMRLHALFGPGVESSGRNAARDIADAERMLSHKYGAAIGLLQLDDPSMLRSIETPDDCRRAETRIPNPWKPRFSNAKILLNPRAGTGKSLPHAMVKLLKMHQRSTDRSLSEHEIGLKILSYLHRFKIDAEIITPKTPASIVEETRRCVKNSADLVIAAGGDGTINSVINGLAYSRVPLGVIPLGTANVLAIELAVPPEIRSACQLLAQGEYRAIDLGKLNGRYFSCVAGIGLDAYVSRHVERHSGLKKRYGGMAFLLTGIVDYFRYRFHTIRLTVDDQPVARNGYLVLVGNGRHYGGDLVFSPNARMDDGLLDVVIFKSKNPLSVLRYLRGFLRGTLPDCATIEYLQGKRISVARKGNHLVQVDGEYSGRTPLEIEVAPGALHVIC